MGEAAQYAIKMHHVTKTFGKVVANKNVDLELKTGEILALLGENGSGKTTLMNMLSGIYFPDYQARYLASEISYYYKKYGIMNIADFYTYLSDKSELVHLLSNVLADELPDVDRSVIQDYFQVIHEYNRNQEIKRLQKMIVEEVDPLAKAKLGERIRKLKMGSEENAK